MDQIHPPPPQTNSSLGLECPTCGLPLTLVEVRNRSSFSCPSGHVYLIDELLAAQSGTARQYLLEVIRMWEQKAIVLLRVAQKARAAGHAEVADAFQREVRAVWKRIAVIQGNLLAGDLPATPEPVRPSSP